MKLHLKVYELHTKDDIRNLKKAVSGEKGIKSISIDAQNSVATVKYDESILTLHKLKIIFLKSGFITGVYRSPEQIAQEEQMLDLKLQEQEEKALLEEQQKQDIEIKVRARELAKKLEEEAIRRAKEGISKAEEDRLRIEAAKREEEERLQKVIDDQRKEFERQMRVAQARQERLKTRLVEEKKSKSFFASLRETLDERARKKEESRHQRFLEKEKERQEHDAMLAEKRRDEQENAKIATKAAKATARESMRLEEFKAKQKAELDRIKALYQKQIEEVKAREKELLERLSAKEQEAELIVRRAKEKEKEAEMHRREAEALDKTVIVKIRKDEGVKPHAESIPRSEQKPENKPAEAGVFAGIISRLKNTGIKKSANVGQAKGDSKIDSVQKEKINQVAAAGASSDKGAMIEKQKQEPDAKFSDVRSEDVRSADNKSSDVKTAESKSSGVISADTKSSGIMPAETKSSDAKSAEIRSSDVKSSEDKSSVAKHSSAKSSLHGLFRKDNLSWLLIPTNVLTKSKDSPIDERIVSESKRTELPKPKDLGREYEPNEVMERLKAKALFCLIFGIPLLYLGLTRWYGLPSTDFINRHYALFTFILATPIFMLSYRIFVKSVRAIITRKPYYQILPATAAAGAYIISLVAWSAGLFSDRLMLAPMFDVAGVIAFAIISGNFIEAKVHSRLLVGVKRLISMQPKRCIVVNGLQETEASVENLKPGDVVNLQKGSWVPADGMIVEGYCSFDESRIAGNRYSVEKEGGDMVYQGSLCIDGAVNYRVSAAPQSSLVIRMVRKVMGLYSGKGPYDRMIARMPKVIIFAGLFVAGVTAGMSIIIGSGPADTILATLSVLAIAVPSLFAISAPTAILAGNAQAIRNGVLFRSQDSMRKINSCDTVVLDIKGTITESAPFYAGAITAGKNKEDDVLKLAASAYLRYDDETATEIQRQAGIHGLKYASPSRAKRLDDTCITATLRGRKISVGTRNVITIAGIKRPDLAFMEKAAAAERSGLSVRYVISGKNIVGCILLAFRIRPTSEKMVKGVIAEGKELILISSETDDTIYAYAMRLGIDRCKGNINSEKRIELCRKLGDMGRRVLYVGSDSDVLGIEGFSEAVTASIIMTGHLTPDIDIETDAVLLKNCPKDISYALRATKIAERRAGQNVMFSYLFNTCGLLFASGFSFLVLNSAMNPVVAAALMAFAPVAVIVNSMRIPKG